MRFRHNSWFVGYSKLGGELLFLVIWGELGGGRIAIAFALQPQLRFN